MAAEEMIFLICFPKYSVSVAMATNQIQWFGKNSCLVEDYSRNILKNFCQNICNEIEIKA